MVEARVWAAWLLAWIGYAIRPYDMLADRRRWRWQPRLCCVCGRRHRRWRRA